MKLRQLGLLALPLMMMGCATPATEGSDAVLPEGEDLCRASQYQGWIGRNRSELPAPPQGAVWRVVCSTCPMTMDYNPVRLNIVHDADSGIIQRVSCG